jgi:hypothetical protein
LQQEYQNISWEIRRCAILLAAARETVQRAEQCNDATFIAMPPVWLETVYQTTPLYFGHIKLYLGAEIRQSV